MYESYRCNECGCLFDRSEEGASILYCPACNEYLEAEAEVRAKILVLQKQWAALGMED